MVDDRTRDRSALLGNPELLGFGAIWTGPRVTPPDLDWADPGDSEAPLIAPLSSRVVAMVIDTMVLGAGYFLMMIGLTAVLATFGGSSLRWPYLVVNGLAWLFSGAYFVALNGLGQTLGKRVLHLSVVDRISGTSIGGKRALVRYLVFLLMGLPFGLGWLSIALSPRSRGWHDQAADDVVVAVPSRV